MSTQAIGSGVRPILLLEMNEVPWRVVDLYRKSPRHPNLARFFDRAETYTTEAVDEGELSPWVTWPSLHRGMGNLEHGIRNLGQDPGTFRGVPIWEEYLSRGLAVGVCGSMQSWPPLDPGPGGFYIPDTFAHDERCFPARIEPFQRFNLGQVQRNGRVLSASTGMRDALPLLVSLPSLGIRPRTVLEVARHLLRERINPDLKARRPIFQTILLWDIFRKLFDAGPAPAFSSFFTNHVAGVMHRFWHHVFPEDFPDRFHDETKPHRGTMDFAMDVSDRILGEAMAFAGSRPDLTVVFASSMGQAAVHRDRHEGIEASIPDLPKLMHACGLGPGDFCPLLAMVPQVAAEIPSAEARARLKARLEGAATVSGDRLFKVDEIGNGLSITILTPSRSDVTAGSFLLGTADGTRTHALAWDRAGIRIHEVEPGTAYHIPEGVMAVYREGAVGGDARTPMRADRVKGFLMGMSGLEAEAEKAHPLRFAINSARSKSGTGTKGQ